MFVTSRLDGIVYEVTPFKEAVAFARNLGVATGIAFDGTGVMYVGDRTGTIFKVNGIGEEKAWVQLEPSVSAFHLAFGEDDSLYVTGPTVTSLTVFGGSVRMVRFNLSLKAWDGRRVSLLTAMATCMSRHH